MPRLSYASIVADDIVGLSAFYASLFELEVDLDDVTDVFRGIDIGHGTTLAIAGPGVYDLLGLDDYRDPTGARQYLTYELDTDAAVDDHVGRAVDLGGRVLRTPYVTVYDAYQAVLADPEGNPFRLNHARTPTPATRAMTQAVR